MKKPVTWLLGTLGIGLCLLMSACVFVNSSAISESAGAGNAVKTEYSDYGILHLTAPDNLTSGANTALAGQCQSGMISDVQTQLSTREWFGIVQYYTVTVAGVCK